MRLARVVLFIDEIAACLFQSDFGRVGKVLIVINYQDARLLLNRDDNLREKVYLDCSVHNFPSNITTAWVDMGLLKSPRG
jgi:hypothetical protein